MTVLSKFSRLTDPELSYWSKLPQDVLGIILKQPQLVARENFDACMRELMYGRRRRQYNTFAELYDPDLYAVQLYPNRARRVYLCFRTVICDTHITVRSLHLLPTNFSRLCFRRPWWTYSAGLCGCYGESDHLRQAGDENW